MKVFTELKSFFHLGYTCAVKHLLCCTLFLFSAGLYGQKEVIISGIVSDTEGEPLSYVDVLLKKSDTIKTIVAYGITDKYGRFSIVYQTKDAIVFLETSSLVHQPYKKALVLSKSATNFKEDIVLKHRLEELEEVAVTAKPILQVKNDTTYYNLSKILNGSERVVEEILKKLPGITINENGRLKFKGKEVRNVLLDGDNLFDGNYTIGTKSINASHISGVQAIENFEDNPLLQGLSENDQVALNLNFKKGVLISGDVAASIETQNRYALNAKNIGVSSQFKGFSVFSFNNIDNQFIGSQFSAEDFIGIAREKINDDLVAPSFVASSNIFSKTNSVSNNQFFGSLNVLPKISKTKKLRINIDALADKKEVLTKSFTLINENTESPISIVQTNNHQSKPRYLDGKIEFQNFISSDKSFSTNFRFSKLMNLQQRYGLRNGQQQSENIDQEEIFVSGLTNYVHRLNNKSALKFGGQFVLSEKKEFLSLMPGINLLPDSITTAAANNQNVYSVKKSFQLFGSYYKKIRKEDKFNLGLYLRQFTSDLNSDLFLEDENFSGNHTSYSVFLPEIVADYFLKEGKLSIRPILKGSLYAFVYRDLNDQQKRTNNLFLYDAIILLKYELDKRNSFSASYNQFNEMPQEEYFYSNFILKYNRVVESNKVAFKSVKTAVVNMNYRYDNLSKNTSLNLGFTYEKERDKFLSLNTVNDQVFVITNVFQNNTAENKIWNFAFTKYLIPFRSTITLSASHTATKYFNFLNSVSLRQNRSDLTDVKLGVGTAFIGKFLFGNKLIFNRNNFSTEGVQGFSNALLMNELSVSYVQNERFRVDSNLNYVLPNTKDATNKTIRLNASLTYVNKKKTITYNLYGRNILNQSSLEQIDNSDIYSSFSSESIFDRLVVLSVNFKY